MPRKKNNISNNDKNNKINSRKANSKHKLSDADKKELDDKIMKTEIETLNKEIVYYKQKISELKSKLKTAYINDVFENKVIRAIHEKNIILEPLKPVYINTSNKKKDKEVVVLNLSDIHFGERVNKEEMGGLNEYDMDIARQRIERLTKGVISIINILSNSYKLDELRIYGLGDFISGLIHTELVETADGDLVDWLYIGADIISRMILEFARYFKKITFIGIVGNHGEIRRNNKKVFKRKYVNWDYIIYKNIEFMCQKNKRIKFIIPKSFFYIDQIFDYRFLLLHGDNIKGWMGIPWYGIQRAAKNFHELLASRREYIDYIILGHFHNTGALQTVSGEILINGSIVGGDEFSLGSMVAANKPYQLLFGVHKNKGITFRYNMKLSD